MSFEQETQRLRLRRPAADDLDGYVTLHSDPRTYTHAPASMPDAEHCRARLESDLADWDERGFGYVAVEERSAGRLIGWGGVKATPEPERVNLYYRLSHDALGQGYGRELAGAVVAAAVQELPGQVVRAVVKPHNHASMRTAEAASLMAVGTEPHPEDRPNDAPSVVLESPRFTSVRLLDEALRTKLLDICGRVNDDGGAVGFRPGAPRSLVAASLAQHEAAMSAGRSVLGLLCAPDGRPLGFGWVEVADLPASRHVAMLWRLQVDPEAQGRNTGRLLLAGLHGLARSIDGGPLTHNGRS